MKKFSLIARIRLKRATGFSVVVVLVILISLSVFTDLFRSTNIAKAVIISSGDTIPFTAEYDEVIVRDTTINMNKVRINRITHEQCGINDTSTPEKILEYIRDKDDENCDSKRTFSKLTLEGTAKLTHEPVNGFLVGGETSTDMEQDTNGDNSIADETTGSARWKKVDIELTGGVTGGDLTIGPNASIDVEGKGYSGGSYVRGHRNGFGPGGGGGMYKYLQGSKITNGGYGGGHRGPGGRGYCYNDSGGLCIGPNEESFEFLAPSYGLNNYNFPFDFGSGGGSTSTGDDRNADGGNGGGRVRVNVLAGNVDLGDSGKITADGQMGEHHFDGNDNLVMGGGGAGGSVIIFATNVISTSPPHADEDSASASVKGGRMREAYRDDRDNFDIRDEKSVYNDGYTTWEAVRKYMAGGDGHLLNISPTIVANVSAKGAHGWTYTSNFAGRAGSGGGGGGYLEISASRGGVQIKKRLEPYKREDVIYPDFNPYALMVGDEIIVSIVLSGLVTGQDIDSIEDVAVGSNGVSATLCRPVTDSLSPPGDLIDEQQVSWGLTSPLVATDTEMDFIYHCVIEE